MPIGKCYVDWDGQLLVVRFVPPTPSILAAFKAAVPQVHRHWDKDEVAWRITTFYLDEVELVCEEHDYALRDFTGSDTAARVRQAEHRLRRENRERAWEEKKAKTEREERRREHEDEQRKERARRASDSEEFHRTYASETEGNFWRAEDADEDDFEHIRNTFNKKRAFWRTAFFQANPEMAERDFNLWWTYFTVYGSKEEANKRFGQNKRAEKAQERAREGFDGFRQGSGFRFHYSWEDSFRDRQRTAAPPAPAVDHYAALGILESCTQEEAKTAYLTLARELHPNSTYKTGGGDENRMKKVNAAYDAIKAERKWK